jgi:hypothetical protein
MNIKITIITVVAVALVLTSANFGIKAFMRARQLQTDTEVLAVRTRTMRHELGELEQKLRVMQRVGYFMDRAALQGLSVDRWSVYEVNVQDQLSFKELGRVIEQCEHTKDIYFKPASFHITVGPIEAQKNTSATIPPPIADGSADGGPADVLLGLKGAFLVRH